MTWRTDFENMPRDGSMFFVMLDYDGVMCPDVLYREFRCTWEKKVENVSPRRAGGELHPAGDPALVPLYKPRGLCGNYVYESFWYTPEGACGDGECGSVGDSAIDPSQIVMFMLPPTKGRMDAVREAIRVQEMENPQKSDVEAADRLLREHLEDEDEFWLRWVFFADSFGVPN